MEAAKSDMSALLNNFSEQLGGAETKLATDWSSAGKVAPVNEENATEVMKKFLITLVRFFQGLLVLNIIRGVSVTGQFNIFFGCLLIVSFLISFVDFILTATIPDTYKSFSQSIESFQILIGSVIINFLSQSSWGATGDDVTVLRYLITYGMMITFLDSGLSAALTPLPDFLKPPVDFINKCIKNVVDFFGFIFLWIWSYLKPVADVLAVAYFWIEASILMPIVSVVVICLCSIWEKIIFVWNGFIWAVTSVCCAIIKCIYRAEVAICEAEASCIENCGKCTSILASGLCDCMIGVIDCESGVFSCHCGSQLDSTFLGLGGINIEYVEHQRTLDRISASHGDPLVDQIGFHFSDGTAEGVKQVLHVAPTSGTMVIESGGVAAARRASLLQNIEAEVIGEASSLLAVGKPKQRLSVAVSVEQTPFFQMEGGVRFFSLDPGEYIQAVKYSQDQYLKSFQFITNTGRESHTYGELGIAAQRTFQVTG